MFSTLAQVNKQFKSISMSRTWKKLNQTSGTRNAKLHSKLHNISFASGDNPSYHQ